MDLFHHEPRRTVEAKRFGVIFGIRRDGAPTRQGQPQSGKQSESPETGFLGAVSAIGV
jgi:hypothetical protein